MDQTFFFRKRGPAQAPQGLAPMNESSHLQPAQSAFSARPQLARLNASIVRAAAFLPIPGPITAFAFLNTLQALEDLPFDQGMSKGADLYGCQPYLAEDKYREHLAHGRIRLDDLAVVLREELGSYAGQMVEPFGTRFDLRLTMLRYSSPRGPAEELRWFVAEMDALTRFCPEVSLEVRRRMVDEVRDWIVRKQRERFHGC